MNKVKTQGRVANARRQMSAVIVVGTLASSMMFATPAFAGNGVADIASAQPAQGAGVAARAFAALAAAPAEHELLQNVVSISQAGSGKDAKASIPIDPANGIALSTPRGQTLNVALPFADRAGNGVSVRDGALAYDNLNGSLTVPIAKTDGSVQIATVIEHSTAPTSYRYEFSAETGLILDPVDGGAVVVRDAKGQYQGAVAPPWAYDAAGEAVKTWYEVDGTALVQVVAHNDGAYAYPVVADPWLGINLFGSIWVDTYQSQPRVNLDLSPWGASMWYGPQGYVIMNTAGWDEAWTRSATIQSGLNKPSQRQQFECHALGSPFAGTWNLEKVRPNRTVHWTYGVAVHHCNWTTPDGY